MECSVLQKHLTFIFFSDKVRKEHDAEEERKLKKEWNSKEHQIGTPYAKWLRYLKNRCLYGKYVRDLKAITLNDLKKGWVSQFTSQVAFHPYTMNHVREVVAHMDRHLPIYWKGYWKVIFDEFEAEDSLEARKKLLANRLYHMNALEVTHHKYLGSEKLKKRLIDTIIDKIFFIK